MRKTIRSVAAILAIIAAMAGGGFPAPAQVWAAGERDVTIAQGIDAVQDPSVVRAILAPLGVAPAPDSRKWRDDFRSVTS